MTVNTQRLEYYISEAGYSIPTQIKKRNGDVVKFDISRIENAVYSCYSDIYSYGDGAGNQPKVGPSAIAEAVVRAIAVRCVDTIPTVEMVQDSVEFTLLSSGDFEAAKHYILYRNQRDRSREKRVVPPEVKSVFDADKEIFQEPAQIFNFYDKYSRYSWDKNRRETWVETVDRTVDHLRWEVE